MFSLTCDEGVGLKLKKGQSRYNTAANQETNPGTHLASIDQGDVPQIRDRVAIALPPVKRVRVGSDVIVSLSDLAKDALDGSGDDAIRVALVKLKESLVEERRRGASDETEVGEPSNAITLCYGGSVVQSRSEVLDVGEPSLGLGLASPPPTPEFREGEFPDGRVEGDDEFAGLTFESDDHRVRERGVLDGRF
jgi:hypothetical protein